MSKILLYADNHFSENSSILRKQGLKYTLRLENQIKCIDWIQKTAEEEKCSYIICLGDFFDKPVLTDRELTALREIKWSQTIPNLFLVGNHESSVNGLTYNSTKALEGNNRIIISNSNFSLTLNKTQIHFIPYIIESDRLKIENYLNKNNECNKHIILSHNDLKGIDFGKIVSKTGFEIDDIEKSCDLFINGHLHNGSYITPKIRNLGNLTGQNFSENGLKYKHNITILDTDTLEMKDIENPYAFKFYKLEINDINDLQILNKIENNSLLTIKCNEKYLDQLNAQLESIKNKIIEHRIIVNKEIVNTLTQSDINKLNNSLDYLDKFILFCREKIENTEILETELNEVCK